MNYANDTQRAVAELKKENAELREQLEYQTKQGSDRLIGLCKCGLERDELREQLAAANKRLEEAEKHEPVAYIYPAAYGSRASLCKENKPVGWDDDDCPWYEQPLYTRPIPPADVADK